MKLVTLVKTAGCNKNYWKLHFSVVLQFHYESKSATRSSAIWNDSDLSKLPILAGDCQWTSGITKRRKFILKLLINVASIYSPWTWTFRIHTREANVICIHKIRSENSGTNWIVTNWEAHKIEDSWRLTSRVWCAAWWRISFKTSAVQNISWLYRIPTLWRSLQLSFLSRLVLEGAKLFRQNRGWAVHLREVQRAQYRSWSWLGCNLDAWWCCFCSSPRYAWCMSLVDHLGID